MSTRFPEYYAMLTSVLLDGADTVTELNQRTGTRIRAMPGGTSFQLDLSDGILPTCGLRKTWPHVAAAELAWCLRGDNHVDWLRSHTKVWDDFADVVDCVACDGTGVIIDTKWINRSACKQCTGSGDTYWLDQAYGYRWRQKFGIDQLAIGIERLRADLTDRRVWISSWDPREDILPRGQKTVPCPVGFTLSTMAGRLNSSFMLRSSDVYMGLPHDIARHAFLMAAVASSLGINPGIMRVTLAHPHLYEPHWAICRNMLEQPTVEPAFAMPHQSVEQITQWPDDYVRIVKQYATSLRWPEWAPKVEVVK